MKKNGYARIPALVSKNCHNKVPQPGWLKQQKDIAAQFWTLEVQNRDVGWIGSF